MNKPPIPPEFIILSGPSKFDFLNAVGFRKHPTQSVTFKLGINDQPTEIEVEIIAIMVNGGVDDDENGEGHSWRFYTSAPWMKDGGGHLEQLRSNLVGCYSTKTRRGWVRPICHERALLVYAAFEHSSSIKDLKDAGYRLPDNEAS